MQSAMFLDRQEFIDRLPRWADDPPLTLALADIDGFAAFNESQGHDAGDIMVDAVQRIIKRSMPTGTYVARLGGDEFGCALPATTAEETLILVEEIRQHLTGRHRDTKDDADNVSMSFGVAAYPQHVSRIEDLYRAADDAMHRAKREGGGRVAIYVEDRMTLKSNYYTKAQLARLTALADRLGKTEASLLREALADLLAKYRDQ
jgi:diguanylate cyclase (GGDEF)-like protein